MNILAIDQSYTSCGFVVLKDGNLLHAERFTSNTKLDVFERAAQVAEKAKELAHKFKVKKVAMEGLAFAMRGNATRDLAGLQFVIMYVMHHCEGFEVEIVAPNTVKKVATGSGKAKKEELLECLPKDVHKKFLNLGVKKSSGLYDLTDAYWIGIAAQAPNAELN